MQEGYLLDRNMARYAEECGNWDKSIPERKRLKFFKTEMSNPPVCLRDRLRKHVVWKAEQ